ncbi:MULTISPECIES: outer membrane protein assembly factor BamB family protein [unclassified Schlesneria]|uniref:outer membrane protein assembly factor BamB family protein n=1 Tax=unclassified Schlesneria TaxID=2762017 RepID=UPI002EFD6747
MTRSLRVLTMVALVTVTAALPVHAQLKGDAPLPTHQQLTRIGLERAWWGQAVTNPHRDKVKHVSIDETIVYVQSSSGVTTAFDAENGQQLWAVQLGRFDQPSFAAISNETEAMIIVGSTMYGLDKRTGRTIWTLVLDGQPSTGPAADDTQVYYGTIDGMLHAYSLSKIQRLFEQRRLPQWSLEAQVWTFKAGKEITSPPITNGRVVNFASRDGSLYSISAANRKLIYQLETDQAIVAPLASHGSNMFMASEDLTFFALDLFKGKIRWEFTSGLPVRKAPVAFDNELYVIPDRGGLYSLDPNTGDRRWWKPDLTHFIAATGDAVAASDVDGNLVMISRENGAAIGSLPLHRFVVRPSNDRTDRIYMATEAGLVICLRQTGHSYPVYHRFPDRLPLLPEITPEEGEQAPVKEPVKEEAESSEMPEADPEQ